MRENTNNNAKYASNEAQTVSLKGREVLLGVCGGIAAYKAANLASLLVKAGAGVTVVMTENVDRTYEDLYRAADIAMYFAKAQGGNQAIFYSKDLLTQARGNATTREDENARTVAEQNGTGEDLR